MKYLDVGISLYNIDISYKYTHTQKNAHIYKYLNNNQINLILKVTFKAQKFKVLKNMLG